MKKNASNQFHLPIICSYFPEYHAGNRNGPAKRNQSTGKESVYRKGISSEERNQFGGKESVQPKGISSAERNPSSGKDSVQRKGLSSPNGLAPSITSPPPISPAERNKSTGNESVRRKGIHPTERNQSSGKVMSPCTRTDTTAIL